MCKSSRCPVSTGHPVERVFLFLLQSHVLVLNSASGLMGLWAATFNNQTSTKKMSLVGPWMQVKSSNRPAPNLKSDWCQTCHPTRWFTVNYFFQFWYCLAPALAIQVLLIGNLCNVCVSHRQDFRGPCLGYLVKFCCAVISKASHP